MTEEARPWPGCAYYDNPTCMRDAAWRPCEKAACRMRDAHWAEVDEALEKCASVEVNIPTPEKVYCYCYRDGTKDALSAYRAAIRALKGGGQP